MPGCGQKHTKFIHVDRSDNVTTQPPIANDAGPDESMSASLSNAIFNVNTRENNTVCLPVVPIVINNSYNTCALLDSGSTNTFCSRKLIESLGITGSSITYSLNTVNCTAKPVTTDMVNLCIKGSGGEETMNLRNVYVIDNIPANAPSIDLCRYEYVKDLPVCSKGEKVELLIGQDHAEALLPLELKKGRPKELFAVRTKRGWSLNGPVTTHKVSRTVTSNFIQIQDDIHRMWEIENYPIVCD